MGVVERDLSIDRYRGVLVILMVIGDYLAGIEFVPAALKHATDLGLTVADLVAPAFVFVIGLNFGPSFGRRLADGFGHSYMYFFKRYLSLVGIGALISGASNMVGQPSDWGVLQALGEAGLIAVLFIRFPTWARFVVGGALLIAYQLALDSSMLAAVLGSVHGGFFGSVSWGAMLVLSTAVADIWRKGRVPFALCTLALLGAAALSALLVPISKHRVSLSYVLLTLAISAAVFLVIRWLGARFGSRSAGGSKDRAGVLSWWGQHALPLYLVHLLLLGAFVALPVAWWYAEATPWLAAGQLAVILGLMSVVAWWLNKRAPAQPNYG